MLIGARPLDVEIRHFHLCCGIGAGAAGFNRAGARVGNLRGRFRCLGGVDVDARAIEDFGRLTGASGTVLDLFSAEQYREFHGHPPPSGWREASPDDLRRAAHGERPHIIFISAPCKGFSGLLAEALSKGPKYQALNGLALRAVWLALEAWGDDPPELFIFENVPRIARRGRGLLDAIGGLLRSFGYAVAETRHDCGEIGGLAQRRERFLLVARHMARLPDFLYEPPKRRLKGVGEVLECLPPPGDPIAGPMHRLPNLHWRTWVRLAFVEAGGDWRSLNRLKVEDGMLAEWGIVPEAELRRGVLGVNRWDDTCGTISGRGLPLNGAYSVADPRPAAMAEYRQYGVRPWDGPSGAVSGQSAVGGGAFAVADPRPGFGAATHHNVYRVVKWEAASHTITAAGRPAGGAMVVADPRAPGDGFAKYAVTAWDEAARTVLSGSTTGQGAYAVADPRPAYVRQGRQHYHTAGMYGVVAWDGIAPAVNANGQCDNGKWSVADPRGLPAPDDKLAAVIIAADGTWHRPFTTLELAALQTLFDPADLFVAQGDVWRARRAEPWQLAGSSDSRWREGIGNAVPSDAARAIGGVMGRVLLAAWSGQRLQLVKEPIWVQPVALALAVQDGEG